ncbi:LTA synthase family protein [Neobacillus massiliamazoniensis]|uniref:Phosphoglycerol transferase n=1 Tax=Neobacillus massiliamazoniensis TaxID=1499688 RepID=A0A0U1NXQ3_9BACI|nr:LTA synthase family protein [Neobacillus massiliamazoniensis]CRK82809.1 phosphoglycerol transferase [Neobacillus massiliamazoniensis]
MIDKIKKSIISFIITGIYVFLLIFVVEWIYLGSFNNSYIWIKNFTKPFTYNFIIVFLLFSLLQIFRRKLCIIFTFLLTVPFIVLAIASRLKVEIRGEPVLPPDLFLTTEASNMTSFFSHNLITWLIVGAVVAIAFVTFLVFIIPNQKKRNWIQICLAALLFFTFIGVYNVETKQDDTLLKRKLDITYYGWNQKATTQQDGVIAGFLLNMKLLKVETPNNYSQKTIEKITKKIPTPSYSDSDKPNVIMIQSEAFWDPTVMKNVEFNKDPLPFFHKLQQENTSGTVTVPVFGGNTVNTEFEALTGMSLQFLPVGSIPYINYVTKPIPALPYIFRENGYEATAIHTYHNWFYSRDTVFKNLGFNRFDSLEYMPNPIPDGDFYHDKTITDEIMRKINMGRDKPNFIYAITTQNHGPYPTTGKKPYANMEVKLKSGQDFTPDAKNQLETYCDNLTEIDKQLESLITQLQNTKKKTIVVFWGDHLPLLGDDYKVYREAGYYKDAPQDYDQYLRMYSTPLLIWDNFSGKKENLHIGSNLLGPVLLDRIGMQGDNLTNYLLNEYKNDGLTKIVRPDFLAKENIKPNVISDLKLLQYDTLFGKMYGVKDKQTIQPDPTYRLGYVDPKITGAKLETIDGEQMLVVQGENFTPQSYVNVNGKDIARDSGDENGIRVPMAKPSDTMKIGVNIMDTNGKILSKSNTIVLKK